MVSNLRSGHELGERRSSQRGVTEIVDELAIGFAQAGSCTDGVEQSGVIDGGSIAPADLDELPLLEETTRAPAITHGQFWLEWAGPLPRSFIHMAMPASSSEPSGNWYCSSLSSRYLNARANCTSIL